MEPESQAPLYEAAPTEVRDIQVTVEAAGVVEPETTVEVKSKASGEILAVHAETGDVVEANTLLVEVDQRTPRNRLAEVEAALVAARARRTIAETQMKRSETLFESGTLTQADFEQTQLEYANSQAQVVSSEVAVENARIAMDDTDVRAPITGTIIEKQVEPGMVISSPTQAVSDGTVLMKMANLDSIRVRTLVDETDIGKIQPNMVTRVTVAAYPNQPFEGLVLKIEPQAIVEQNVTMFAVLIRLDNPGGMLKPGMNAEVEIQVINREGVLAVPTAALRTDADMWSTAAMLGLTEAELARRLNPSEAGAVPGNVLNLAGRRIVLPEGLTAEQVGAAISKQRSGKELSAEERAMLRPLMQQVFSGGGERGRGEGRPGAEADYQFGGEYWVVKMVNGEPVPVKVQTGLTDLAYSEIMAGLDTGDSVLLLPSSSLFEQQARLQQMISERFSSTPFQQQQGGNRGRRPF
jgi:HlyD family secretion protein